MVAGARALIPVGAVVISLAIATAADRSAGDLKALADRVRVLVKDRTATAAEREAVVAELAMHPTADSAALIVSVGLAAAAPGPRSAARSALVAMSAESGVRAQLVAAYTREARRGGPLAAELGLVLLASEREATAGGFRQMLDRQPPAAVHAVVGPVLAAASAPGDPTAIAALRGVAGSRCFAASLACRRGLIETLVALKSPPAVELLIDVLELTTGEARGDVITYLSRISGERHGTDARAWRAWFEAHRTTLALDDEAVAREPTQAAPAADAAQADYYGIPIYSDRVVFVLDTSSSMQGAPLDAAKRELESAIFGLPDATLFTVLFFNSGVGPWRPQLVPATEPNKRAAAAFVNQLPAEGGTATSDALEAAFTFDTEAIFFLSDGAPSAGRIVDPRGIVDHVTRLNQGRYVSVNTISIMGGAAFLEELAKANHGSFRAVDR